MKSKKLLQLRRLNSLLKKNETINFVHFLETVSRSIETDDSRRFLSFLQRKDFRGLIQFADSLSSTLSKTASEHRLRSQLSALVRKYPWPKDLIDFDPRQRALDTFLRSESKCRLVNRKFHLFDTLRSPHEDALCRARSWINYVLGDFSLDAVLSQCDFGPGASLGTHGNATNFARKILSKNWSVSTGASDYAYAAVCRDAQLAELLLGEDESPYYCLDAGLLRAKFELRRRITDYNKISFVPKTVKTERTIAVEPMLNGFLQKGVDCFMRLRLKRVGIDLQDQTVNQRLSEQGSREDALEDPYVTIDLSSASDSISIGLVRNLLHPEWYYFLNSIRSHSYELNGDLHRYHKFVTMGNGFCFPLETLIFASLCVTAYNEVGRKPDYSVYGDDIIVRRSVADRVLSLLGTCGFKANLDKTFLQGPFRESCGTDWFNGVDVRPVNLDYAFDSIENIFKFCNIVRSKDAWQGILGEGVEFLKTLIPPDFMFVRPFIGPPDTALEVPFDIFLSSPFSSWDRKTHSWSWIEVQKSPVRDFAVRGMQRYSIALLRGALTGSSSSKPFTVRRKTSTKLKRVVGSGDKIPVLRFA